MRSVEIKLMVRSYRLRRSPAGWVCKSLASLALAAAIGLSLPERGEAAPKPSAVPQRWALDFEPGELRLFTDEREGRVYWYFTYKVTNKTDQDQIYAPEFTLLTDNGDILVSGRNVQPRVEQDLLDLLANDLMESQNQVIGEIRQGPGQAREGLVVWPVTDLDVTDITMFIAGLSGDTAAVRLPGTDKEVILRKTLQRDYLVPGNAYARRREPAELVGESWIFR